jgi:hypothetical protein
MNQKTLAKLSPEGREAIIRMEAKLKEIEEEKSFLDSLLERFR